MDMNEVSDLKRENLNFKSEKEWLEARTKDVTSTEVSALFNKSPYLTEQTLFSNKRKQIVPQIADNEYMKWGRHLQDAIAHGVAKDKRWIIEKRDCYTRIPDFRMGSSFDYMFGVSPLTVGGGLMEIKNVDKHAYQNNWDEYSNGDIKAPTHIELQVQHQMLVGGFSECVIAALVGGNTLKLIHRKLDIEIADHLIKRVKQFWDQVHNDKDKVDDLVFYEGQLDQVIDKFTNRIVTPDKTIEADELMIGLLIEYAEKKKHLNAYEADLKQLKAQILEAAEDAHIVTSPIGTLRCGMTKGSQGKLVTDDMLGTYINGRKAHRQFLFNPTDQPDSAII